MTHAPKILLLGGTADGLRMAAALQAAGIAVVYSVAGRVRLPALPPGPHRIGGFGGTEGLTRYLRDHAITHVIDATHPFAAQMSAHAVHSCAQAGCPLIALERQPWRAGPGDNWRFFDDIPSLAAALPSRPMRIFLAIGRQHLQDFAGHRQHDFMVRLIEAPQESLPLAKVRVVVSRGPFDPMADAALMQDHGTELLVAKNAGGQEARAKLDAARSLGLPVWLAERPQVPARDLAGSTAEVMAWLKAHPARLGV